MAHASMRERLGQWMAGKAISWATVALMVIGFAFIPTFIVGLIVEVKA